MVTRLRLWESLKQQLTIVGIVLLITVGFPYLTEYIGRDKGSIPFLLQLETIGYYTLRGAPVVIIFLFIYNLWSAKRKQKQLNQKINEEGITYLILPRPDGEEVQIEQVTLWHRYALAMPYYKHVSFEMTGGEDGIVFSLRTTEEETARNILSKIMAEWPGSLMRRIKDEKNDPLPPEAYWTEIKPVKKDQPIVASTSDPLKALLTEISVLPKGIKAGIQVMVREDPFTRVHQSRKADDKTRKETKKQSTMIGGENKAPVLPPSAEQKRQVQWLDERAQEAFLEARLIIWAASDDDKIARRTAIRLAETISSQYHPNNKLIKGWSCKKGPVRARTYPAFSGRPWVASELGTIAHLVGRDALLAAPQLKVAPARPLPASVMNRYDPEKTKGPEYLTPVDKVSGIEDIEDIEFIIENFDDIEIIIEKFDDDQ